MKFDVFCEVQLAKPWPENHEQKIILETKRDQGLSDMSDVIEAWIEDTLKPVVKKKTKKSRA